MRSSALRICFTSTALLLAVWTSAFSQSTDQSFPTAVQTSEVAGTIRARDIGDARLTSHYYGFSGDQGDIFVNVVTKNFEGDIDIFTVDGLRPLSKIVIFADAGPNETGRIVYLRRSEKMLLRVQGRSPDDNPAIYRIKFAGSFVPARSTRGLGEVKAPEISNDETGSVRVNSVGTIIEAPPAPKAESVPEKVETPTETAEPKKVSAKQTTAARETRAKKPQVEKKTVVVTEPKEITEKANAPTPKKSAKTVSGRAKPSPPAADPMANFRLIILFKDGKSIERPMTEVLRFSMDGGVLTVITKSGFVGRYSMGIIAKVSVE